MKSRSFRKAGCFLGLFLLAAGFAGAQSCQNMDLGNVASLNGFLPFSGDPGNLWNTNIANAPVDPNSDAIIAAIPGNAHLHPDFGPQGGIPYVVVDSSVTPSVTMVGAASGPPGPNATQSDAVVEPAPITAPIEGDQPDCLAWPNYYYLGDTHMLVADRNKCVLYETYLTSRCNGVYAVSGQTVFDLQNFNQRPWGWTSSDAAGLPVFAGLVKYDEATNGVPNPADPQAAGYIQHAFRFTMERTKGDNDGGYFVLPASHGAAPDYRFSTLNVLGMRLRLKSDAATMAKVRSYSPINQSILTAMQQYGIILADNGGNMFVTGTTDPRWNTDDLGNWHGGPNPILPTDFEVVQMTPEAVDTEDGTAYSASVEWSYMDANSAPYTVEDVENGTYPGGLGPEGTALSPLPNASLGLAGGGADPVPGADTAGSAPAINIFTASATSVAPGTPVTFTMSVSNDTYDYIDNAGTVRLTSNGSGANTGTLTVTPLATQTYTLNSMNAYGISQTGQAYAMSSQPNPPTGNAPPSITVSVIGSEVPIPLLAPATGTYDQVLQVVIAVPGYPQAQIYYTTDQSTPTFPITGTTQLYTGPINIANANSTDPVTYLTGEEVQAIAMVNGFSAPSPIGSAVYIVSSQNPAPTFTPPAGTYTTAQVITINDPQLGVDNNASGNQATIFYTTDGTTPAVQTNPDGSLIYNANGDPQPLGTTQYFYFWGDGSGTGPFTITSTTTVNAIAAGADGYTTSPVATAVYNLPTNAASYSVSVLPGTVTIAPGAASVIANITITAVNGFTGAVALSCAGLPEGATCSFSPTAPNVGSSGTATSSLTIFGPGNSPTSSRNSNPLFPAGATLAGVLCIFGFRKRRRLQIFLLLAVSVIGLGLFTGCGGNSQSAAVTSTVTVTGTSGTQQGTGTFTLVTFVNQ
ncbi:MAG: chitobiase/beta-hexosaminidase C-terminal domain-containing protein [Terracidiphilus sp.]